VTKVLLVDDDDLVLDQLERVVTAAGYDVVTARNGDAALLSMQREFAPIVIADIDMPQMDGLALCRSIRRQSYSGYVYVMLLSSKDAEGDILTGLDAGADDYVSKRTPTTQLVGRLRTAQRILALEYSLKRGARRPGADGDDRRVDGRAQSAIFATAFEPRVGLRTALARRAVGAGV